MGSPAVNFEIEPPDQATKFEIEPPRPDFAANPPEVPRPTPKALRPYNPNDTGPLGDLIGGSPGAYESSYQPTLKEHLQNFGRASVATAAGALGAPLAAEAIPAAGAAITRQAAKHPLLTSMVASEGIRQARRIPYVGPLIPPYSEFLPFLFGGKGKVPEGVPEAPTAEMPAPEIPPVKVTPASVPRPSASEAFTPGPRPVIAKGPIPGSRADLAETREIEDRVRHAAENEGRTILSQGKREWFARNQPGTSKGELTGVPEKPVTFTKTPGVKYSAPEPIFNRPSGYGAPKVDFHGEVPPENQGFNFAPAEDIGNKVRAETQRRLGALPRPTSKSSAPAVSGKAAPKPGTTVPTPTEDLVQLLEKSLKAAKKAKGRAD